VSRSSVAAGLTIGEIEHVAQRNEATPRTSFATDRGCCRAAGYARIARTQTYPSWPVRLIVGCPSGGVADIVTRIIGQWLSERLSTTAGCARCTWEGNTRYRNQSWRSGEPHWSSLACSSRPSRRDVRFESLARLRASINGSPSGTRHRMRMPVTRSVRPKNAEVGRGLPTTTAHAQSCEFIASNL